MASLLRFRACSKTDNGHPRDHGVRSENEKGPSTSKNDNKSRLKRRSIKNYLKSLYLFTRPYSVIGTLVQITSISLLAVETTEEISKTFFIGLLKALAPTALVHIYVVGLNQIYDVELDKLNKPFLPLPSGDLSMKAGITIVSATLLMSLGMGYMFQSPPILHAVLFCGALGTTYSVNVPFLRWKRQPFLTALSILLIRAFAFPLAAFAHMQKYVLGKPLVVPMSLVFTVIFMFFIAIVISVIKDIPDADGDKEFGIQTFSVRLGRERVFSLCVKMLSLAYGVALMVGISSPMLLSKFVTIVGHSSLLLILWRKSQFVNISDNKSTLKFYMFIWKLFYAEYFLIPFVR